MRSRAFPSSEARVLLSGLAFPESPRWCDGRLWVCNWGAQEIVAVDPEGGEGFAAGQVEGDDIPGGVRFCVDFRGEAAARAPERLAFLPPFAPAADTCARTTVESNI
jgi:sugar lactone lactonase YvrE